MGEDVKKSIWFFFTSFRRKPESSVFKALAIDWTPVFTGVTALKFNFFTPSGRGRVGVIDGLFHSFRGRRNDEGGCRARGCEMRWTG